MNDILAKPFTKNGLFGILDKHLMHLKQIQLNAEIPRSVGLPPLSDQGVLDALSSSAQLVQTTNGGGAPQGQLWDPTADELRNPLAAMGWSDDTYQIILSVSMISLCAFRMCTDGILAIPSNRRHARSHQYPIWPF